MKTWGCVAKLISQRELTPKATVFFSKKHINTPIKRRCLKRRHVANPWRVAWLNGVQTTARAYRDHFARHSAVRFARPFTRWIGRGIPTDQT